MGNLLMRRRLAMRLADTQEDWDFEWDYTQGKLEDNELWIVDTSGTASTSLIENGEKFVASNNAYYQVYPNDAPLKRMIDGYGVIECVCFGVWSTNVANMRITAGYTSEKRVTVFPCNGKWRIFNKSTPSSCTALCDAANNTEYTIRIVMRDTAADIYINGVLVSENYDTSKTMYGVSNGPMQQNSGSGCYGVLKSLKLKSGRIE